MVLFRGLNKPCSDLISRDFVHDKPWEVELKHTGRNPVLTQNASINPAGVFAASSSIRHTGPWGFVDAKFATGFVSTDASFKSPYLPGLTVGGRIERKNVAAAPKGSRETADVSIEFNGSDTTAQLGKNGGCAAAILGPHMRFNMSPFMLNWTASATSGVAFGTDTVGRIGAEVSGPKDLRTLSYSVGGSITQTTKDKSWSVAVMGTPFEGRPFGKILGTAHCKNNIPGAAEVGAEVVHYPATSQTDVSFGGLWYLNQPVGGGRTDTALKLKVSHDAKAAVSFSHKVSDTVTATVSAQVDPLNLDTLKCGMRLNVAV